jgi:UDP-N-acetyl-D-mannosaminuronic acid dehydrogenase
VEPNIEALPASLEGARLVSIDTALAEADIVVLLVDHRAFKKVGVERLAGRHLVDTRGVWTGQNRRRSDAPLAQPA